MKGAGFMAIKYFNNRLIIVVLAAFICLFSNSQARVVDGFTSYELDSNLLDNEGVPWEELLNSNNNSPEVKDISGGYPEYDGKYIKFTDNNIDDVNVEQISIALPAILSQDGDFVEIATYRSNEPIQNPLNPENWISPGGVGHLTFFDVNDTNESDLVVKGRIGVQGATYSWWWQNNFGVYWSTENNPNPNKWYIIRATMRDGNSDGNIDSFDFEAFDINRNLLFSRTANGFVDGSSSTQIDKIALAATGTSSVAVVLFDHLKISPEEGIFNCEDVWDQGYGLQADVNFDCLVNLKDFAVVAADWLKCNIPSESECMINW